ncbi:MAG: gliding motility-associated ABC transporter substrate-binding protein GldG [Flavicella sp.]
MFAIFKKEIRQFLGTLSTYIIIASFLTLSSLGLWFLDTDNNILRSGYADMSGFFNNTAWLFVLLIPALTMKSFSDERQSGTLEILYTKPISSLQIITGKAFAVLALIAITLTPTLCYVYTVYHMAMPVGNIDSGSIVGSYIGLLFIGATFISIGIWVSSFAKSQLFSILTSITVSYFVFFGIQNIADLFPNTGFNFEKWGMYSHFSSIAKGVIDTRDLSYFAFLSLLFLTATYWNTSLHKHKKKVAYTLMGFGALFVATQRVYQRFDLTQDHRYTLKKSTLSMLTNIKENAVVRIYLDGEFPAEFNRLQEETLQLLEELKAKNNALKVLLVDPVNQLEALVKSGMSPSRLTVEKNGIIQESVILPWATISYKNKKALVPLLKDGAASQSQAAQIETSVQHLEYAFANGLKEVTQQKNKRIAVLKGNGELQDIYIYSLLKSLGKSFHLAEFTLDSVAKNPQKTLEELKAYDLAIIAKPTEAFSENEKYTLDQYSLNGGNTLWMLDYVQAEMDSLFSTGQTLAYPRDLNLDDFFFRYGARFNSDLVKDLYASKIALSNGNMGSRTNYQNYLWFYHPLVQPTSKHPIVNAIPSIQFRFASSIDTLRNKIKKTVLLQSSILSKTVSTPNIVNLKTVVEQPNPKNYANGSNIMGLLLEGTFSSAYKDRVKPYDIEHGKIEGKPAKMILFSDGDIGKNQIHKGQPLELGRDKWTQEFYGNKELLLNAVDYLIDDSGLLAVRSKKVSLKLLNKKEVSQNKSYWKLFNLISPLLLVGIAAFIILKIRKRKYLKVINK